MAIKRKKIDGAIVTYKDSYEIREAVFEKVLAWFLRVGSFSGECIMQSDKPQIEAPELLIELADDVFEFDVTYNEDEI